MVRRDALSVSNDFAAAVLATILPHVGFANKILRADLLDTLRRRGYTSRDLDRKMRLAVEDLRNLGYMIITDPAGSGWCMASCPEEAMEWAEHKMLPSARSTYRTVHAVLHAVARKWPMEQLAMTTLLNETERPGMIHVVA